MKFYRNLINAAAVTLKGIFFEDKYADKALEELFRMHRSWGSRDRKFVAEAVYEVIRNYRLFSTIAESDNNFWRMIGIWLALCAEELPDWPEFSHIDVESISEKKEKLRQHAAVYESFPDWLWELGLTELGKESWEKEAVALNKQAPVFLRANALKTNRESLREKLKAEGYDTDMVKQDGAALRLVKRTNLFKSEAFKKGLFEVQDLASQEVAVFLGPKQGERVIDACAGTGGKSLHMAALMGNKGRIISLDTEERKLIELKKRAVRAGAYNIETKPIEKNKTIMRLRSSADKLLLDVPCSGSGVLRRNPDTKWKLNPAAISRVHQIQYGILSAYPQMLKPGGTMVYSTCSIFPSENRVQVERFLSDNKGFELIDEKNFYPHMGFDGFYMARIRRNI